MNLVYLFMVGLAGWLVFILGIWLWLQRQSPPTAGPNEMQGDEYEIRNRDS